MRVFLVEWWITLVAYDKNLIISQTNELGVRTEVRLD